MFDVATLDEYIEKGFIRSQTSEDGRLTIYNYTETCAFDRCWDLITMSCRGLIQDQSHTVARPFPKFFNLGEHESDSVPDLPPVTDFYYVQDKLDGSLIITTMYGEDLIVATRGSFESDQAIHAREILHEVYPDWRPPKGWTVLFEILYPANRIVVDYGGTDDLVLLGAVNNLTGEDWPIENLHRLGWPGSTVPLIAVTLREIEAIVKDPENGTNREGFVFVWPRDGYPSFRLKMKFAQYVMLHKIVTGLSTTSIWEALSNGQFVELLEVVPDEWHNVVRTTATDIIAGYNAIADQAEFDLAAVDWQASRKDQAEVVKTFQYPHLVFAMLDNKPVDAMIWKMVKPLWQPLIPVLESQT